jgi:eukaryotic-like serine/threonine-protein kinase
VPREGIEVERGTRVRLFISSGPEQVSVPDVVGLTRDSAETELQRKGLEPAVQEQPSDKPQDEVIAQDPTGGVRLDKGERVTITVSTGKERVTVPGVVGDSAGAAASTLRAAGLKVTRRTRAVDNEDDDGKVVEQRPGEGVEVDKGRQVVIVVGRFEAPPDQPTPTPGTPQQ